MSAKTLWCLRDGPSVYFRREGSWAIGKPMSPYKKFRALLLLVRKIRNYFKVKLHVSFNLWLAWLVRNKIMLHPPFFSWLRSNGNMFSLRGRSSWEYLWVRRARPRGRTCFVVDYCVIFDKKKAITSKLCKIVKILRKCMITLLSFSQHRSYGRKFMWWSVFLVVL